MPDPASPVAPGSGQSRLAPAREIEYFALLKHRAGDGSEWVNPRAMDLRFWGPDGKIKPDTRLQQLVHQVSKREEFKLLRFAIADLTTEPIVFAGNTHKTGYGNQAASEFFESLSTGKLAIMYAAYQLQYDLRWLASQNPQEDGSAIFQRAYRHWLDSQADGTWVRRGGEKIPLPAEVREPKLKRIFDKDARDANGLLSFPFLGETYHYETLASVNSKDGYTSEEIDAEPFFRRLWLAIDVSSNGSATSCIKDIGYLYINSLMLQSGLYDPDHGGGFSIGGAFVERDASWKTWTGAPRPDRAPVTKPPIRNGLTAASCVAFMTLLAKDRLVNRDACDRMRFLLNRMDNLDVNSQFYKPATLSSSPLGLGLTNGQDGAAYTPILKELSSKLGVGHGLTDCAFIERKSPPIKYAVACVYCSGTQQRRTLRHLAAALDRCVQECHS